jgi:hypothetical protein
MNIFVSIARRLHSFDIIPYIPYLFLFFFFIIVVVYTTIRIQYGFWFYQPVFHAYDVAYYFYKGIIREELPTENKFVNKRDIKVVDYNTVEDHQLQQFVHFINAHFHKRDKNQYIPKKENIVPYFSQHRHPCFFSFYMEDEVLQDVKHNEIVPNKKCIGVMTTRPLTVTLFTKTTEDVFDVYYADYMCVHMDYRKKGTAPQIIQTHEYVQRHQNKEIVVSLFKREGQLTGIVPLCVYKVFCFPIGRWRPPVSLPNHVEWIEGNLQTYYYLNDFMKTVTRKRKFDVMIAPNIVNQLELIKSNNLFVSFLLDKTEQTILAAYFFKDSCMMIDDESRALTCIASICDTKCKKELFISGFKNAFWRIIQKYPQFGFGYCVVENTSDNDILLGNLMKKTAPLLVSPAAYFFYNFAFPTVPSNKVFILS